LFRVTEQPLELHVPLIILRGADYPIALLVDSVSQILSVGAQTLLPVQKSTLLTIVPKRK
jgi:chemotaxis signal transduction protein